MKITHIPWKSINRIILGVIFLTAGIIKFMEPSENFAKSIASFEILPTTPTILPILGFQLEWPLLIACILPILEVIVGVLLLLPNRWVSYLGDHAAKGACIIMASGFLFIYAWTTWQGINPHCGCFGSIKWMEASPPAGIIRSLILLIMALSLQPKKREN
jgi:hypothetical protein